MPNSIKKSSDGLALQVTDPARSAGLVEETEDGDPTYRAEVRVFTFDGHLLVFDRDEVETEHIMELVTSAARDTKSIYRSMNASVQPAGDGYQIHLPNAEDAGFRRGDTAPAEPAPGMLVISTMDSNRLSADLVAIRRNQVE